MALHSISFYFPIDVPMNYTAFAVTEKAEVADADAETDAEDAADADADADIEVASWTTLPRVPCEATANPRLD